MFFYRRTKSFGRLVYEDCSSLGRMDNDKSLVIPVNESLPQNVYSGVFHYDQVYLDDIHETSLGEMSSLDDCVLQVNIQSIIPNSFKSNATDFVREMFETMLMLCTVFRLIRNLKHKEYYFHLLRKFNCANCKKKL